MSRYRTQEQIEYARRFDLEYEPPEVIEAREAEADDMRRDESNDINNAGGK